MKNIYKLILLIITVSLAVGCSDNDEKETYVDKITITNTTDGTIFLKKYQVFQLDIKTEPATNDFKCISATPNVFQINDKGEITALDGGVGSLVIVAKKGDSWAKTSCVVEVTAFVEQINIVQGKDSLVAAGATLDVSKHFTIQPLSAKDKTLKYRSLTPEIASVDAMTGIVTPIGKGVAKIVAEAVSVDKDIANEVVSKSLTIYSKYERTRLITTGWIATAINFGSSYRPSNIIDGNINTMWHCNWSGAGTPPPYWVLIDMLEERAFDRIEFYRNSTDTRGVEFYISPITTAGLAQDDPSFEKFDELDYADEPGVIRMKTKEYFPAKKYKSRYLKVILPDTNRAGNNSISEIFLYNVD